MIGWYTLELKKILQETPTIKHLEFKIIEPGFTFKSGQWVSLEIETPEGKLRRSFSIASAPSIKDEMHFCVKYIKEGKGSPILHKMEVGDKLRVMGAFGVFFLKPATEKEIVFIATGSGIAPFRGMLQDAIDQKITNPLWIFFGNRNEDEIIYRKELEAHAKKHKNIHLIEILSKPSPSWKGETGHVQEAILKYCKDFNKEFYICGLKDMVLQVTELLEKHGAKKEHIHFERYN